MRELRKDPIVGRWVIISTDRAQRPTALESPGGQPSASGGLCPLCPGHEEMTPPEIMALRPSGVRNGPGWTMRVVPNKFPALRVEEPLVREGDGMYDRMSGLGAHEVIIETPRHDAPLSELSTRDFEDLLWVYHERMADLRRDMRLRYVLVFKNHGEAAGATLAHPHSQLIALPFVPRGVKAELWGAGRHYELKERCIYCDIVREERRDRSRVVHEEEGAIAFAPWAPRAPFETWILPTKHASNFEETPREDLAGAARALRATLRKLDQAVGKPPYNFMLHTAPLTERGSALYHWHFEVMPTLSRVAGFEWGSGCYINPTPPEEAAQFLRKLPV